MKAIYFGLWASMLRWKAWQRAAVVVGVLILLLYLVMPLFFKAMSWIGVLFEKILLAACVLVSAAAEFVLGNRSFTERAARVNGISAFFETTNGWVDKKIVVNLREGKRIHFVWVLLCYVVVIAAIAAPDFWENKVHADYLPAISKVADIYQKVEWTTVEEARKYPPIIDFRPKKENEEETADMEEQPQEKPSDIAEEQPQEEEELWLSLSSKGRDGANVRKKSSKESEIVDVVYGDDTVLYLNKQRKGWVRVQLENGKKGWIRKTLLEGVPENDD